MSKVAFITGASRGIGKATAIKLAREGWDIVVAAKTVEEHPRLPGTIYTAAREIGDYGTRVLPVRCDVRDLDSVSAAANATIEEFGRIDAVINNAGALWWKNMDETPMRRFDLVMEVNARGAFAVSAAFLPKMKHQDEGHFIFMSPPVDLKLAPGHIAYYISKFGMTLIAMGLGEELKGTGLSAMALWPKTMIESSASINFKLGDRSEWRKPDILADAVYEILLRPEATRGKALIDEDFLRSIGHTDFEKYNCVPGGKPRVIWKSGGVSLRGIEGQ